MEGQKNASKIYFQRALRRCLEQKDEQPLKSDHRVAKVVLQGHMEAKAIYLRTLFEEASQSLVETKDLDSSKEKLESFENWVEEQKIVNRLGMIADVPKSLNQPSM